MRLPSPKQSQHRQGTDYSPDAEAPWPIWWCNFKLEDFVGVKDEDDMPGRGHSPMDSIGTVGTGSDRYTNLAAVPRRPMSAAGSSQGPPAKC